MESRTFLWLEDRKGKAGYLFWETLMKYIAPHVTVESRKNNSELVKAVKAIADDGNRYLIVFDNSFDNLQIYQEQRRLKEYVKNKRNVFMVSFICFEYILLEFTNLIKWIYGPEDEFLVKRVSAITAREKLVHSIQSGNINYKDIQEIIAYDNKLENHNIEQLSAKLLFELTRNTGFEITKGSIGKCWIHSCCDWTEREADDLCGLDQEKLSVSEKMKCIYEETSLKRELEAVL